MFSVLLAVRQFISPVLDTHIVLSVLRQFSLSCCVYTSYHVSGEVVYLSCCVYISCHASDGTVPPSTCVYTSCHVNGDTVYLSYVTQLLLSEVR